MRCCQIEGHIRHVNKISKNSCDFKPQAYKNIYKYTCLVIYFTVETTSIIVKFGYIFLLGELTEFSIP